MSTAKSTASSSPSLSIQSVFPTGASYRVSPANEPAASVYFEDSRPGEDAPVIAICLPGIGDTRRQFRLLAPLLHEQLGLRVLLGDLRGCGDSTDFSDGTAAEYSAYSPESVASDVSQLMDELHAKHPASEFVLLANSLAAGSMVLAALDKLCSSDRSGNSTTVRPSPKVKAVVLLGPVLRNSPVDTWFRPLTRVMFVKLWGGALWGAYYKTLFPGKVPPDFDAEFALLRTHLSEKKGNIVNIGRYCRADKSAVETAVAALGDAIAHATNAVASSPPPAVLAFYGRNDPDYMDFDAEVAWIKSKIPSLTCEEIENGGHYPHLEEPQRVVDALARLL
ncbi:hypothetical protein PybrP1_004414 [[Pythium] brassicae (nom. inval.)]|nr:hypothetical protein PybrP1_004414 [[Pythium] brassicae (nom. inval.)]